MNYNDALNYIHSVHNFGVKSGLENIKYMLKLIGNPQDTLKFVHVAGTNGKGSTSCATASVLKQAGYRVGLYISPFVSDFCERIQVDGIPITYEALVEQVESIKPIADKTAAALRHPTEFETITAIAFNYFAQTHCDIVVLEVGLGGRFDSTNVINTPLVSVITSISYDHTAILGNTLAKIAFEKCGIIKHGGVTVTCPNQAEEALEVIMYRCAQEGNTLLMPSCHLARIVAEGIDGTDIKYGGLTIHIPLIGRHQIDNFLTAYEVLTALRSRGFPVSDENIIAGFANVSFPARMEVLCKSPVVILDGAHNPSGAAALAYSVKRLFNGKKIIAIMGMLADKDYKTSIGFIAPLASSFYSVTPTSGRALNADEAANVARRFCENVIACDSLKSAFLNAASAVKSDDIVIICGSLYLAGDARHLAKQYF